MRKNVRKKLAVPLYNCTLLLNVSKNIKKAAKREKKFLVMPQNLDDFESCGGLTCYAANRIGVFLTHEWLTHEAVGHELLHATFRILDRAGVQYSADNPEAFTYLNGFLHQWTHKQLKKAKIRVSH